MNEAFEILKDAITDCGYWRWWTATLPDSFQIEFSGVQLYEPPPEVFQPPSSVYALRFVRPGKVELLEFANDVETDWLSKLHADKLEPLRLSRDEFFLGEAVQAGQLCRNAVRTQVHFSSPGSDCQVHLAFRAGRGLGLFVAAESVRLLSHTGEFPMSSVARMHNDWWKYWRRYWDVKDTPHPMPRDNTCEICIPAGD